MFYALLSFAVACVIGVWILTLLPARWIAALFAALILWGIFHALDQYFPLSKPVRELPADRPLPDFTKPNTDIPKNF